ncbi:MAG: CarD family transcriptional regulator [Lachnospira eligens]
MFEIGDKVVYGVVGVCEVEKIDTPPIKGISGDYYFFSRYLTARELYIHPLTATRL